VASSDRDQALYLADDGALSAVGRLAAEGHRCGDMRLGLVEELAEDQGHGSPWAASWRIRHAACAPSRQAARSSGKLVMVAACPSRSLSTSAGARDAS
jgi:hypothetical protein